MDELPWAPKEHGQGFGDDGRRLRRLLVMGALHAVEEIQKTACSLK